MPRKTNTDIPNASNRGLGPMRRIPFCKKAGISTATFDRRVKDGSIKIVKIGSCTLVPSSEQERLGVV